MTRLSKLLGLATLLVSRSIFLYGLTCLRMGSTILALAHTVLAVYMTVHTPIKGLAALAALIAVYTMTGMAKLPFYASLLASIPAAWMALTNLAFTGSLGSSLEVFVRAEVGALHALYLLHAANPSELSAVLRRFSRRAALTVQLFWRISAHTLRETAEMLQVHSLKRVSSWKSLAMMLVRGEELSLLYADGLLLKEYEFKPRMIYSKQCVVAQAGVVLYDIVLLLLP